VLLSGSGFDKTNVSANAVTFNNIWFDKTNGAEYDSLNATIVSVTDTLIAVVVPLGAIEGNISVSVSHTYTISSQAISFLVLPTLKNFFPNPAHAGDTITITGSGFNYGHAAFSNFVTFNNAGKSFAFGATPTSIKVVVPTASVTGPITVSNVLGNVTSKTNFVMLPKVSSLNGSQGEVGSYFGLYGSGFDPSEVSNYKLTINGLSADIISISTDYIGSIVPPHAAPGKVVLTYKKDTVAGPSFYFTVIPTLPHVQGYNTNIGTIGSLIKIFGDGFDQVGVPPDVAFGKAKAKIISYNSDTITVKVPAGAANGAIAVSVAGVSAYSINLYFTVNGFGSAISPMHAKVGDTVRVKGTGFGGYFSDYYFMRFPNHATSRITATSDSTMMFVVPINATAGVATVFSEYNLNVSFDLPYFGLIPTITKIEPDTVYIGRPNQLLTISGTGFGKSAQTKRYDLTLSKGVTVKDPYVTYDYKIQVMTPGGITTGPVSLAIDSMSTTSSFNLVALPDTFPYKPSPPFIFSKVVTTNSISFGWNKSYRAIGYNLDISSDNFTTFLPGYHGLTTTDTLQSLTGLNPGTNYQVRVRAYSKTDTSDYAYGYIITLCNAPVAVGSIKIDNLDFVIRWFKTKGAQNYTVEASIDNFVTVKTVTTVDTVAYVKILTPDLIPLFKFRVRAYNSSGYSEYSNIVVVPVTEISPVHGNIALYPNPVQEYVFVTGINESIVESYLVDEIGQSRSVRLEANSNQYSLDVRSLPKGTYILRITTTNGLATLKFIKL
jgi:hypothetical protein